jgi:hypothetical protein
LSLPLLHSLHGQEPTKAPRRLVCMGTHLGFYPTNFFPADAGRAYTLSPTLQSLKAHQDNFTVFSNLEHGVKGGHGAVHSFLSGVKKQESAGFPEKNMTLDQLAAEHVGSATRYPSITTGIGDGTQLCWNRAGVTIPPVNNPARLFAALFVESSKAEKDQTRVRLTHRGSVLDALRESANATNKRLNAADRDKLDQYLTSVREAERQLQMSIAWSDRPKPKTPMGTVADEERMHIEEIPLLFDLLTLALQTDSTRVATFELPMGFSTSDLNVGSYHGLSHHGKSDGRLAQLKIVEEYLFTQFARFLDKLDEAKGETGRSLLDDTAVVIGSGMGDGSRHSNKNLPVILAGGGIKHQGHLVCPEDEHKRVPLCNLWLSTLQWFGVEAERFGRSTGTFTPMEIG